MYTFHGVQPDWYLNPNRNTGQAQTGLPRLPVCRVTLQQATVTRLVEDGDTVRGVLYKDGEGREREVRAPLTFVCDGCFSNLRKSLCTAKVSPLERSTFHKHTTLSLSNSILVCRPI